MTKHCYVVLALVALIFVSVQGDQLADDALKHHIDVFFSSFVLPEHSGSGVIKQAQLFGRNIQVNEFRVNSLPFSTKAQAQVSVTDTATGKSVTKTAVGDNDRIAVALAGSQAAFDLFKLLEEQGYVKQSTFIRNNQVQLCDDQMRLSSCQKYASRGMCQDQQWAPFLKTNCFYTCFNCGKGWN